MRCRCASPISLKCFDVLIIIALFASSKPALMASLTSLHVFVCECAHIRDVNRFQCFEPEICIFYISYIFFSVMVQWQLWHIKELVAALISEVQTLRIQWYFKPACRLITKMQKAERIAVITYRRVQLFSFVANILTIGRQLGYVEKLLACKTCDCVQ